MPRFYGVRCSTCEEVIRLGECEPAKDKIEFYVPPLDPISCKSCGASHVYGSDDIVFFD
jgi:uncharacterized protein with PIN domain